MVRTTDVIQNYKKSLLSEHNTSKEYGDYIENYNKIAADLKNL